MNRYRIIMTKLISAIFAIALGVFTLEHAAARTDADTSYANLGLGCHVRANIPFNGRMDGGYNPKNGRNRGGFSIEEFPDKPYYMTLAANMECLDSEHERVIDDWATFDKKYNKWIPIYSDEIDRLQRQEVTKIYPIQAINSQGFVVTEDDFMGDEERRGRTMHFCLIHSSKALCGDARVMRLNDPKSNILPYVFEILRSIEFVEDVPPENPVNETEKP